MRPVFARLKRPTLDVSHLLLIVALWFTLLYNHAFFRNAAEVFFNAEGGYGFMLSLGIFLFATTLLGLALLSIGFLTKPVLILAFVAAAAANTYMNSYNVVIDTTMITNIVKTDSREVNDLFSTYLVAQMLVLGLLPALVLGFTDIRRATFGRAIFARLKLIGFSVGLILLATIPFSAHYASFFREHKVLRYYANPLTPIYSSFVFLGQLAHETHDGIRRPLGLDAHITHDRLRKLVILVVGEAARADHFSLNGYARETNPLLSREDIINYPYVSSCGTATAYSLPCMFSLSDRSDFELDDAQEQENLLDVLARADVNVLWRDNNSDSKGVAVAIAFEDYRSAEVNPVCDIECRDVGMLSGLPEYIAAHPQGDIVIVLHQMGNHGPAYYKRYPAEFERFTPVCRTNQLELCSDEEIVNAYDNAILYTDWFLAETIQFLKSYDKEFETAMYYMGDHGESLGENGIYLHGLPYFLAPGAQKQVPSFIWLGSSYRVDREQMLKRAATPSSHDNYFHTVLGMLEVETSIYKAEQDLITYKFGDSHTEAAR